MPLRQLADEIIRLSERYGSTPVLVTPTHLSLRKRFFLELVGTLVEKTDRSIRIDWYRGIPSLFSLVGDRIASAHAASMNRALATLMSGREATADIQITGVISRPAGVRPALLHPPFQGGSSVSEGTFRDSRLVIGLCDQHLALPTWATPIRLATSPTQLVA